jgi:hypothetical protein
MTPSTHSRWFDIWAFVIAPERTPVRFSWLIFCLFFILCVSVNYPGRLNEDSLQQLIGLHDRRYLTDVHSPVVTLIWSVFWPVAGQPASALIVQSALLSFFAAIVPKPPRWGLREMVIATAESLFKLSLVISAGFIIKDVLFVGLLLAGLAAIRRAGPELARPWLVAGGGFFALSLLIRPTNFALLALASALVLPLLVRTLRGWILATAATVAVIASSVPIYSGINRLLHAQPGHAEIQLLLFDSAGISSRTGQNLFKDLPGWPQGLPDPRNCYMPLDASIIAPWAPCKGYAEAGGAIYAADRSKVIGWWLRNIASHPIAYAQHRLTFTGFLLDPTESTRRHPAYRSQFRLGEHHFYALNSEDRVERFQKVAASRISVTDIGWWRTNRAAEGLVWFSSKVYEHRWTEAFALLLCLALLVWQWLRRWWGEPVHLAVAMAAALGIGNVAMHCLIGIASQPRYLFPTVCCAAFALLLALSTRAETARTASRSPG